MFVTGHHAIEFVVRSNLHLPSDYVSFGEGRIELKRITPPGASNEVIYDGTIHVQAADADAVAHALDVIASVLNRLAYAFDASVAWVPKYDTVVRTRGRVTPSDKDLHVLDRLLASADAAGQEVVDEAIGWYNTGRTATNPFVAFLCTYIAFEHLATAIWSGEFNMPGGGLDPPSTDERREARRRCVGELHNRLYASDPVAFVREAYFECVVGLNRQVREVAEMVFGKQSPEYARLYEKRDGYSPSAIRSDLAHGRISLNSPDAQALVRDRLADMQEVAYAFLLRVTLGLQATEELPPWSQNHELTIDSADPRSTLCTTSLDLLPATDWTIRPEWIG